MIGDRLTLVAQRLVPPEAFEHLIGPAIADMQFENQSSFLRLARHYFGIALLLVVAVHRNVIASVTWPDVSSIGMLVFIQATYYASLLLFVLGTAGPRSKRLDVLVLQIPPAVFVSVFAIICLVSLVPVAVCYWLEPRCSKPVAS